MSSGEKEPGGYYPTPPKRRRLNPRIDLTGDSAGGAEPDPPVNVPVPVAPVPVVPVAPVVVVPESPRQERCYMCDMNRCFLLLLLSKKATGQGMVSTKTVSLC